MKLPLLCLAGLVTGLSLHMAAVAAEEQAPAQSGAAPSEKKICRREASGTGSIMPKRVCHTQAEWDALEKAAANDIERMRAQDRSRSSIGANL